MDAPSTSSRLDEFKASPLIKYLKLETKETYPTQETKVHKDQELLTSWNKRKHEQISLETDELFVTLNRQEKQDSNELSSEKGKACEEKGEIKQKNEIENNLQTLCSTGNLLI